MQGPGKAVGQHSGAGWARGPLASGGLTRIVPAAPGGGAPPPVPVHLGELPLLVALAGEGVGGEVADLQAGVVPQEVAERHPGRGGTGASGHESARP